MTLREPTLQLRQITSMEEGREFDGREGLVHLLPSGGNREYKLLGVIRANKDRVCIDKYHGSADVIIYADGTETDSIGYVIL